MKKLMQYRDATIGVFIFGGSVFYAIYRVFKVSQEISLSSFYRYYGDFDEGWSIIGRQRDAADEEWEIAKLLFKLLSPWIVSHVVLSEFLRYGSFLKCILASQLILSASYIIYNFNIYCLLLIIFQPLVFEICIHIRKKIIVWIAALINLMILETFKTHFSQYYLYILGITETQHFMLVLALYWINLRSISYYIDQTEKISNSNFLDALSYCLYLPLLFVGPFIHHEDLKKRQEAQSGNFAIRAKLLIKNLFKYAFWWNFTEIFLHYIYVNVISFHPEIVRYFDSVTLYGFGYSMGQFFHLKYVVMYGLSTTIAQFEGITVPNIPKCIARIHLYSDMWKYFDNGLYKFLVKYIYIPVNNTTSSSYFASFVCFSFVYIWHGFLRTDIFIWAVFNCFAVCLERMFKTYYNLYLRKFCTKFLNEDWERRAGCVISSPLLMMSAISNFYFFGGTEIGNIFVYRVYTDQFSSTIILLLSLCCCGLLSTTVKKLELQRKAAVKLKN